MDGEGQSIHRFLYCCFCVKINKKKLLTLSLIIVIETQRYVIYQIINQSKHRYYKINYLGYRIVIIRYCNDSNERSI